MGTREKRVNVALQKHRKGKSIESKQISVSAADSAVSSKVKLGQRSAQGSMRKPNYVKTLQSPPGAMAIVSEA